MCRGTDAYVIIVAMGGGGVRANVKDVRCRGIKNADVDVLIKPALCNARAVITDMVENGAESRCPMVVEQLEVPSKVVRVLKGRPRKDMMYTGHHGSIEGVVTLAHGGELGVVAEEDDAAGVEHFWLRMEAFDLADIFDNVVGFCTCDHGEFIQKEDLSVTNEGMAARSEGGSRRSRGVVGEPERAVHRVSVLA